MNGTPCKGADPEKDYVSIHNVTFVKIYKSSDLLFSKDSAGETCYELQFVMDGTPYEGEDPQRDYVSNQCYLCEE